jgi:hypothetical protein
MARAVGAAVAVAGRADTVTEAGVVPSTRAS